MGKEKKSCYLLSFFKKGYVIPALFFTALFSFVFILCFEYEVVRQISNLKEYYFILATLAYFAIILFVYLFVSAKARKMTFGDSITVGVMLSTLVYVLYLCFYQKDISMLRLGVCAIFFFVALAFIIMAAIRFNPSKEREIFYTKNNLNGYYHVIFKKFGFLGTLLTAFALTCFIYSLSKIKLPDTRGKDGIMYVCALLILVFMIFKTTTKKVNLFDANIFSAVISLPPTFVLIVFSQSNKFSNPFFYGWALYFLVVTFFFIVRVLSFDNSPIIEKEYKILNRFPSLTYFAKYSQKFGFLYSLSIACILALITHTLLNFTYLTTIYNIINKHITTYLIFPVYFCVIILLGSYLLGSVLALINIKAKKITFGDTFNVVAIFYSLISFLLTLGITHTAYPLLFGSAFVCHLIVFVARIRQFPREIKK